MEGFEITYDVVDGTQNFFNLANLLFVFKVNRGIEVRDFVVGRTANQLAFAWMEERAKLCGSSGMTCEREE